MGTDMTLKIQSNLQQIIIFLYKYVPRHQSASEDTNFTVQQPVQRPGSVHRPLPSGEGQRWTDNSC